MFGDVIVPLDGSDRAATALEPAATLATALDSPLRVVTYSAQGTTPPGRSSITTQLRRIEARTGVQPMLEVYPRAGSIGEMLAGQVQRTPNALLCIATHGRGRSAAIMGSVATEVMRRISGPALLMGPEFVPESFAVDGGLLVALDESSHGEAIVPIAESWAIVFHNPVELVSVIEPQPLNGGYDPPRRVPAGTESAYLVRTGAGVEEALGRPVAFDVLHDDHVARGIVRYAVTTGAAVIAMATHGATGRDRLISGSVAADVIRHSPVPVLTIRPPALSA